MKCRLPISLGYAAIAAACFSQVAQAESAHEIESAAAATDSVIAAENAELRSWIDERFKAIVEQENIPALSVGVIRNGEMFGFFNYGTQSRGSAAQIDENSIFQIASLSKTLTGIVIQSLIAEGRLDVGQPIAEYLPDELAADADQALRRITLGQVLQHQSGITNEHCSLYRDRIDGEAWLAGYSRAQLLDDINAINDAEAGFAYSSCGYAILGLVAETVTAGEYGRMLEERLTSKLGMPDTAVHLTEEQQSRLATPYRKDDRLAATSASVMGYGTPGSGVYSTVQDLLGLQLHQLRAYREFAASGQASDLVLTERTSAGPAPQVRFGNGLIELDHPTGKIYLHDGDADGFAGAYAFSPAHNAGIVVQTSSGGVWVNDTAIDALIKLIEAADDA